MQRLQLNTQSLEYSWSGDTRASPSLILLHEGLGCLAMWKDLPALLAAQTSRPTLAYSRAGYGNSSPVPARARPASYLQDEASHTLPALLDALHLGDFFLLGHSDGASIALLYASLFPDDTRLKGVVAIAPHAFVEDLSLQSIQKTRESFLHTDLRARLAKYHGENVDGAFWGWNGMWLSDEFRGWNIEALLPKISAPVLAIQGLDDEYGTLRQIESLQARCRAQTLLLPGCGHSPHKDQPQQTLDAISRFVRDHT